jgi:hypothetical protein
MYSIASTTVAVIGVLMATLPGALNTGRARPTGHLSGHLVAIGTVTRGPSTPGTHLLGRGGCSAASAGLLTERRRLDRTEHTWNRQSAGHLYDAPRARTLYLKRHR